MKRPLTSNKNNFPLDLAYGLEPQDKEEYEKAWRNSTFVTDQIRAAILRKLDNLHVDAVDDYTNPNWPVLRADRNGQIRSLEYLLRLLP